MVNCGHEGMHLSNNGLVLTGPQYVKNASNSTRLDMLIPKSVPTICMFWQKSRFIIPGCFSPVFKCLVLVILWPIIVSAFCSCLSKVELCPQWLTCILLATFEQLFQPGNKNRVKVEILSTNFFSPILMVNVNETHSGWSPRFSVLYCCQLIDFRLYVYKCS